MKRIFLLIVLTCSTSFGQDTSWDVGVFTGYSVHNQLLAVPLDNGFPAGLKIGAQWTENWRMNFVYQILFSEQDNGDSSQFHSFRLVPGYRIALVKGHNFFGEAGIGYNYADIKNVDQVGQMEFLAGPAWSWNFWQHYSLEAHLHYVHAFDSFLHTSLQQFQTIIGITYQFGNPRTYQAKYPSKDSDQDTIPDEFDVCPSTMYGVKVTSNGCPLDSDEDTIADYKDFCPGTLKGDEIDEAGCPLHILGRGTLNTVVFENQSARLTEKSKNELAKIAEVLKKFPSLFFVIEGHASTQDPIADRKQISEARAISVMNVLIYYGVPANKMSAIGVGDQFPLTDANQKLNERIEIKWRTQQP